MSTPGTTEALEAGIAALDKHYTASFDGVIPECRCGSREDDHEARVVVAAVAPILLAAGRTAAAADVWKTLLGVRTADGLVYHPRDVTLIYPEGLVHDTCATKETT